MAALTWTRHRKEVSVGSVMSDLEGHLSSLDSILRASCLADNCIALTEAQQGMILLLKSHELDHMTKAVA
jgi:hypothetical protein